MEDKKIIVFYVGIGDMSDGNVGEYIERVKKAFCTKEFAERLNCEMILLPTREVNSRIECINPKYIIEEKLIAEHRSSMEEYLTSIEYFIKTKKPISND